MTADTMQCLLCRSVISSSESLSLESYKQHLTGEHKVRFYIKWIVNKTLEDQDKWDDEDKWEDEDNTENKKDLRMDTEEEADSVVDKYSCNECGKELPTKELAKHISTCQGIKVFPCKVENCDETFDLNNKENIKSHIQRHQDEERKKYECNECGNEYPGNELAQHISTCQGIKVFACKVINCTETFDLDNTENIKSHIQRHQNEEANKYDCNECGKAYPGNELAQHISICQGIKIFACKVETCNDTFNIDDMDEIKRHILRHQENEVKYECAECGKEYPKNDLAQHISVCQGIKIFACKVEGCPDSFNIDDTEEVNRHIQRHQDEAAMVKDQLNEDRAAQNSNDNDEAMVQDVPNRDRVDANDNSPYMCGQCFNKYTTEDSLEKHICKGLKREFICKNKGCNEGFANSNYLKNHEKLQHFQFSCDKCDKTSATKKFLKKHMMEHSGFGPVKYECDICEAKFKTERLASLHKANEHAEVTLKFDLAS